MIFFFLFFFPTLFSVDLCDAGLDEEDGGGDIFEEEHDEDLLF